MNPAVSEISTTYSIDISNGAVPRGYKQAEVGVIPEDWEANCLGSLFQPSVSKKSIKPGTLVSFVGMQDVTEQAQLVCQHLVPIENVRNGFTYFERGDVLVAKITPCFENGKGCLTEILQSEIGFGSTEFHVLRATNYSDSRFIYYWTNREVFRKSLESEMVGSAGHRRVPLIAIANYQIPVPPKTEQTAIANALSDVDALIQELEKLIAKKQAIKTATMQQLLTGRTRLPQFANHPDGRKKGYKPSELAEIPEDWGFINLSECGVFQSGSGFPTKHQGSKEGKYPFFKVSDMNNYGNEKFLEFANNYISEDTRSLISAKAISSKSIVFAKIGAAVFLERKKICLQQSCIDNNMMAFVAEEQTLNYEYAYLIFKSMNLGDLVEATALPSLSSKDIGNRKFALPSIEEQAAIVGILRDMDEDTQHLEQRLNKTRQIKQGMMQELLTGKTRLVKPARSPADAY